MKQPLISVCIPTYNGSRFIRECIESVLTQTFTDFEMIISDDGSSDDTVRILEGYASKDSRIKIFHNDTCLKNVNHCFQLANGEWIKFVFHDDVIYPDCLEKMVASMTPEVMIICGLRDVNLEQGLEADTKEFFESKILTLDKLFPNVTEAQKIEPEALSRIAIDHLGENFIGEASNVMLHKSVCARFGFWNGDLPILGDLEFWLRIATNTGLVYIPKKLSSFRVHNYSNTGMMKHSSDFINYKCEVMLLLCQYTFNPSFVALREVIAASDMSIHLNDMFSWWVRDVLKASLEEDEEQRTLHLNKLIKKYPVIAQFMGRVKIRSSLLRKMGKIFSEEKQ